MKTAANTVKTAAIQNADDKKKSTRLQDNKTTRLQDYKGTLLLHSGVLFFDERQKPLQPQISQISQISQVPQVPQVPLQPQISQMS